MWAGIASAAARLAAGAKGLGGVARAAGRGAKGAAGKIGVGGLVGGGLTAIGLPGLISSGLDLSDTVLGTDMLGRRRDARSIANASLSEMLRENDELSLMEGKEFLNSTRMNELGGSSPTPLFNPGEDVEMAGLQNLLMREQSRLGMASVRQSTQPDLMELAQRIGMDL